MQLAEAGRDKLGVRQGSDLPCGSGHPEVDLVLGAGPGSWCSVVRPRPGSGTSRAPRLELRAMQQPAVSSGCGSWLVRSTGRWAGRGSEGFQ